MSGEMCERFKEKNHKKMDDERSFSSAVENADLENPELIFILHRLTPSYSLAPLVKFCLLYTRLSEVLKLFVWNASEQEEDAGPNAEVVRDTDVDATSKTTRRHESVGNVFVLCEGCHVRATAEIDQDVSGVALRAVVPKETCTSMQGQAQMVPDFVQVW